MKVFVEHSSIILIEFEKTKIEEFRINHEIQRLTSNFIENLPQISVKLQSQP